MIRTEGDMLLSSLSSPNPPSSNDDVLTSMDAEAFSTIDDCLDDVTDEFSSEIVDKSVKLLMSETGRPDDTL